MRSCFGLLECLYAVSSLETSFCETPASVTGRRGRPAIVMAAGRNVQIKTDLTDVLATEISEVTENWRNCFGLLG